MAEGLEIRKHADSLTGVEQCFPLGTKIEVKDIVFATGGGGTNTAVTFARQGFKTACLGVIGDDIVGKEILIELAHEGIETKFFQKHRDDFTAYSVILVNPSAERTILSYKGEGQHFDIKKVAFDKLRAKWFYLDSLGGHYDLLEALVGHAVKNKIKIAFNPGGKELAHGWDRLAPILKNIDVYITNKEEGSQLTGVEAGDQKMILDKLQAAVKEIVIVSDGHNGVRVRDGQSEYSAGVPDSPIVERTGAGDAFGSGFVAEYIRSSGLEAGSREREAAIAKSIQFATANASSVVTQFGAKAGILKKGDWGPWPLVEVRMS